MSPHDQVRLRHMIDAIAAAERFVLGRGRADLDINRDILWATATQALPPLLPRLDAALAKD